MIFDLFDYILGLLKSTLYFVFYIGKYKFSYFSKISSKSSIRIYNQSRVILKRNVVIRSGSMLRTHKNGCISIGKNSGLNNNCLLTSFESIAIGENTIIGQGVKIYDHDHVYNTTDTIRNAGFTTAPVIIGNNVWIGSDSIILKGSVIEDNCVIAAGSIVTGIVPEKSLYIQKRNKNISKIYIDKAE